MKQYVICFNDRETAPDRIEQLAADLGITSAQLIKRFIAEGLATIESVTGEAIPRENLEDFLVRNDVLRRDLKINQPTSRAVRQACFIGRT